MWDWFSTLVYVLSCGLVRLRRADPEIQAPLLAAPSPKRRSNVQQSRRSRQRGKERRPDTRHVLDHGHRDIEEDYELLDILGQGAFGIVQLAVHRRTGLRYAVKSVSKAQLRRRVDLEDLKREVQILSMMSSHPNVAALLNTYEDGKAVHIVMELCEGGELFERVATAGVLTEKAAAHFFRMCVEVVRHAHALGICHRDIKPENFMLSDHSDSARVKACDFGLSQFYRPGRNFHSLVGSAHYVAPEVLKRDYGPAADVWSLGVCLYTLLSGLLPFFGDTEEEVFDMVLHADLDLETQPWPHISSHAKDLVQRMLQRDPSRRPTPAEVLEHPWLCVAAPDNPLDVVVGRLAKLNALNRVHKAAMVVAASQLGREDVPGLHAMFHQLDADRSGSLTADELMVALQRQGRMVSLEEAQQMVSAADMNGDGEVSLAEFVAAALGKSEASREDFLRALFRKLDANHDEQLSPRELTGALGEFGVTAGDVRALLAGHDADRNGKLDWREFLAFMARNTGSLQEAVRRRLPESYADSAEQSDGPVDSTEGPEGSEAGTS